eukprot:PLAT7368.1.p1 GENE.PLAT7368.1~~PLAT7368.1.p1  ORF type:complete len:642 (+),score=345.70 PLAT7368.1:663-2588(+)
MKRRNQVALRSVAFVSLIALGAAYQALVTSDESYSITSTARSLMQVPAACNKSSDDVARYDPTFTNDQLTGGAIVLHILGVLYMFLALAIVCDEFFVPALNVITEKAGVSPDVAGATFMAAGGSAPELLTSFLGVFIFQSDVGFGTIVGSAVFNILFVIGMCAIFSKDVLELTWWPLARDVSYYSLSLLILAIFFGVATPGKILWYEALILLLMYVGYVLIMKYQEPIYKAVTCGKKLTGDELGDEMLAAGFRSGKTRAGLMQILISDEGSVDHAGVHVVYRIQGDVRETFDTLDGDGDGHLDRDELAELLKRLGKEPTKEDVDGVLAELDSSGDGLVDLDEFTHWYVRSQQRMQREIARCFKQWDHNGDNHIDSSELRCVIAALTGEEPTEEELKAAVDELDDNKDGTIDQDEFVAWFERSDYYEASKVKAEKDADEAEGLDLSWPDSWGARANYILTAPLLFAFAISLPDVRRPGKKKYFLWTFIASMAWIGLFSYFMVDWATIIGKVFGIPDAVMGLTFLAAGTSVPDLLSSVIVAKQGLGDMAVSSSVGSNIFDVLVGLPLPWLTYAAIFGPVEVGADSLFISILILFAMLIAVIIVVVASGWKMTNLMGYIMFTLYGLFVTQDLVRNPEINPALCG